MKPSKNPAAKPRATGYAEARARKETALARMAELRLEQTTKALVPREAAEYVIRDMATTTRRYFEDLPARIAPMVAPIIDPGEALAFLNEAVRQTLTDVSVAMERHARTLYENSGPAKLEG